MADELAIACSNLNLSEVEDSIIRVEDDEDALSKQKLALIVLKELEGDVVPSEIDFSITLIWVKVYDLPYGAISLKTAMVIGNHVGKFLEFNNSDALGLGKTLNIKFFIDVTKPPMRGMKVEIKGECKWIELKYVHLPIWCYNCGLLGHIEKECPSYEEHEAKGMAIQFGPWLKASPIKQMSRFPSKEAVNEKKWLRNLEERNLKVQEDRREPVSNRLLPRKLNLDE